MAALTLLVRSGERRDTVAAFGFLFAFVGSHTVLETARDALFLSKIPGSRLPWVYLAIAAVSLASTKAQNVFRGLGSRSSLVAWALTAGTGTLAIWALLPTLGEAGLYVLYIWSGVVASLVLTQFWSHVGDLFTVTQAKRLYGVISVGSMAGAVVGGALVSLFARRVSGASFVLFAALGFFASAVVPVFLSLGGDEFASDGAPSERQTKLQETAPFVIRQPYVRRIVAMSLLTTIAMTLSDYLFKSTVSAAVPAADLARVFGATYLVLNVLSFLVQVLGVGVLIRRLPVPYLLVLMPLGLAMGGVGIAITGSLAAALAMKGVDGATRYSVHRTASELLLVPLSDAVRRVAKRFTDVVGQRGGQIVASFLILAMAAFTYGNRWLAVVLTLTAGLAAVGALRLLPLYVDLFRTVVIQGKKNDAYPELDVSSLETLITTLDSDSDEEVLAALRILEQEKKAHVVPALILYHPAEEVVIAALRLFAQSGRKVALHAIGHLDDHPSQRIRAEAIAARAVIDPDREHLSERLASEQSPEARAAIYATMASFEMLDENEARAALLTIARGDSLTSKIVIAEVIAWRGAIRYEDILIELTSAAEPEARVAAIWAIGKLGGPRTGDTLVNLLADPRSSEPARRALAAAGELGANALERALLDRDKLRAVRRQIPSTLAEADPERATKILVENLQHERDGMVRYRSIVSLQLIVDQKPELKLDKKVLLSEISQTVSRAYRYVDRLVSLERGARVDPARATPGYKLLVDLLRDKERNAVGRLFRLLALAFPRQEFGSIYGSIESGRKDHKASALELIQNVLREPLRTAVIGLVDDVEDQQRLAQGAHFHAPLGLSYDQVIAHILKSSSLVVRDLGAYHIAELCLVSLLPELRALSEREAPSADVERALAILAGVASSRGFSGAPVASLETVRAG